MTLAKAGMQSRPGSPQSGESMIAPPSLSSGLVVCQQCMAAIDASQSAEVSQKARYAGRCDLHDGGWPVWCVDVDNREVESARASHNMQQSYDEHLKMT